MDHRQRSSGPPRCSRRRWVGTVPGVPTVPGEVTACFRPSPGPSPPSPTLRNTATPGTRQGHRRGRLKSPLTCRGRRGSSGTIPPTNPESTETNRTTQSTLMTRLAKPGQATVDSHSSSPIRGHPDAPRLQRRPTPAIPDRRRYEEGDTPADSVARGPGFAVPVRRRHRL